MRAETRRQLKEDRFSKVTFEAAESAAHWSAEHQAKLIAAVIAVVVIAAIAFGGWYYINQQDEGERRAFDGGANVRDAGTSGGRARAAGV